MVVKVKVNYYRCTGCKKYVEAYMSIGIVILAEVILIIMVYVFAKKKKDTNIFGI